ncbi:MAG: hypothetical protein K6G08_06940 [Prevotella sp.]|nr:hypothetical protein [Prevotella sp.]
MKIRWRLIVLALILLIAAALFALSKTAPEAWSGVLVFAMENVVLTILAFIAVVIALMWSIRLESYTGVAFLVLGTGGLLTMHILGITFITRLLLIPFVFILLGAVLHVWAMKRESLY